MPTSKIKRLILASGAANSSGVATSTSIPIRGRLLAIHLVYGATSHANTDVVITNLGTDVTSGADQTVLSIENANTSKWVYPRTPAQDNTSTAVTFDGTNEIYTEFVCEGRMKIAIAGQTEGKSVTAYLYFETY